MSDEAVVPDERARREAAEWFTLLNNRTITTQAIHDFRAWRKADPKNARAYDEVDTVWRQAKGLAFDADILRAVNDALIKRPRQTAWVLAPFKKPQNLLILLALGGALAWCGLAAPWRGDRYATEVGEQRLIRLADGSRVRLDTGAEIRVRLRRERRDVALLHGRAFFDVAPDAKRPFVVEAGPLSVRALGTRFDVRKDPGVLKVTLVEGSVKVGLERQSATWTLKPGQSLATDGEVKRTKVAAVDPAVTTSWTSGRLVFRSLPLSQAVAEVGRYDPKGLSLEAPGLAQTRISGVFDSGDTAAFVAAVTELYDLKAERGADGATVLRPAGG